jgi:hypothetical protein
MLLAFMTLLMAASYRFLCASALHRPIAFISLLERPG